MLDLSPVIRFLTPKGLFKRREPLAVFVKKHGFSSNLDIVSRESQQVVEKSSRRDCLFITEGLGKYSSPENLFLDSFISESGVEAFDPIENPYNPEISHNAQIDLTETALSVLIFDPEFLPSIRTDSTDELVKLLDYFYEMISNLFEIKKEVLKAEFENLSNLRTSDEIAFQNKLRDLFAIRKVIISQSNEISKQNLSLALREKRQSNIFIMAGIEHESVFEI